MGNRDVYKTTYKEYAISIDLSSLCANAISKTVNTKRGSMGHISKIAAGDVG